MDTLETNVAKIHIGNSKQTNTYVATLAERTSYDDCELFGVIALPLLNPAATSDCERIASGILGALRRCYKRSSNDSTFEIALGEINDEIGKLASLGQSNWTGKVSAVLGVRQGNRFYTAATGKASGLLMRGGEFSEITEASHGKHPLKTFDTFSTGKIKVGDVLIITTSELFNHVSIDRIKNILTQNTLEIAAQEIVRVIEDTAGPEVAFGTLLLQETEPLIASEEGMTASSYSPALPSTKLLQNVSGTVKRTLNKETAQNIWQTVKAASKKRPNLDIKKLSGLAKNGGNAGLSMLKTQAQNAKNVNLRAPIEAFKSFNRPKQFFTVSVIVLLLAVIVNLFVARSHRNATALNNAFEESKISIQKLLSDADSKTVFKDDAGAAALLSTAKEDLKNLSPATDAQKQVKADLEKQLQEITRYINKSEAANVSTIATLSNASTIIVLPNILATATGKVVVSYNLNTKTTEDGTLRSQSDIQNSVYTTDSQAVIFDGQGLNIWNFSKGTNTPDFFLNVPKAANFVGLVRYPTNGRVYTVDTSLGQVISYLVSATSISKPVVSVKDIALKEAQALALDSSVYVLTKDTVLKYTAGKPAAFTFPMLAEPFSGSGKIYTDTKSKQFYILDSNGRIIITDKTGKLNKILESNEIKGASDFTVDEANKTIYVLRNGSLLKVEYSL